MLPLHHTLSIALLTGSFVCAPCFAQTAPMARPETPASRSSAADFSTPAAAIHSFLKAAQDQDIGGMRSALVIADPVKEDVETLLHLIDSSNRMMKAFVAIYGQAAAIRQLGNTNAVLEEKQKAMEKASIRVEGDTATLDVEANEDSHTPGGTITLRKISGQWKLDAASVLGVAPGDKKSADNVRLAKALADVADQMARDVTSRKYLSVQSAAQEFWTRSGAAVSAMNLATKPAAASGSMPASTKP